MLTPLHCYRLTFELMEACKSQHAAADATSALRPVVGLQGGATQPSPAGKIRAMFTVPQVGSTVTTFFLLT